MLNGRRKKRVDSLERNFSMYQKGVSRGLCNTLRKQFRSKTYFSVLHEGEFKQKSSFEWCLKANSVQKGSFSSFSSLI